MKITKQKITRLAHRANVSAEVAEDALNRANGDLLGAVVILENEGKIGTAASSDVFAMASTAEVPAVIDSEATDEETYAFAVEIPDVSEEPEADEIPEEPAIAGEDPTSEDIQAEDAASDETTANEAVKEEPRMEAAQENAPEQDKAPETGAQASSGSGFSAGAQGANPGDFVGGPPPGGAYHGGEQYRGDGRPSSGQTPPGGQYWQGGQPNYGQTPPGGAQYWQNGGNYGQSNPGGAQGGGYYDRQNPGSGQYYGRQYGQTPPGGEQYWQGGHPNYGQTPPGGGYYDRQNPGGAQGGDANYYFDPKTGTYKYKDESTSFEDGAKAFGSALYRILRGLIVNHLEVWYKGERLFHLPVVFFFLLFIPYLFWVCLAISLIGLAAGWRFRFTGPHLGRKD